MSPAHPTFRPLAADDLALVRALQTELGVGDTVTAARWQELAALQARLAATLDVARGPANATEVFRLARDLADAPPLDGPRWWFHLIGLRHSSAHVVLTTPQGWFVAQRRSHAKDDAPGALDVAVTGHIGTGEPLASAWRELSEEVGLTQEPPEIAPSLVGNTLRFLFTYDGESLARADENPPFIDRERRWVFQATLTADGMARLRFRDGEVSSLLLVGPRDLRALAQRCEHGQRHAPGELDLAPGLIGTLPRWIAHHQRYEDAES